MEVMEDQQRPETSYGQSHPNHNEEDDSETIRIPLVMLQQFQRLASTIHMDYDDFHGLLGLNSHRAETITSSDFNYFMNEVIRKIERMQAQPISNSMDWDEEAERKKKKRSKIKKQEEKILKKVDLLSEDIQYNITKMNQQNQIDKPPKAEKMAQQKLMTNLYKEKKQKQILEEFIEAQNKKIKVLLAHVEKLMKILKIETNKKIKIAEECQVLRKSELQLKEKIEKQILVHAAQVRAINELTEGSKVLEDQLKLMDEKFLELRAKMDVSRNHFLEKMKKQQKECADLRLKFSMATNGGLLDHYKGDKTKKSSNSNTNPGANLTVTIQRHGSEGAMSQTQTRTPFAASSTDRRSSSSPNNFNTLNRTGSDSPNDRKMSSLPNNGNYDRRASSSPTNRGQSFPPNALDPQRKSSSFAEIKRLPQHGRPLSATEHYYYQEEMAGRRQSTDQARPTSAMVITTSPSLTSLSKASKEKVANQIIRRIKARSAGGKESWNAERIIELLEG